MCTQNKAMPRASKSQWDFGDLFPPEETRRVLTVSELTTQVKRLVEQHIGTIWVTGEITNLRQQSSGHVYFTLKDADTQVACVLFRGERVTYRALLEDGQKVVLQGDVTVYGARGKICSSAVGTHTHVQTADEQIFPGGTAFLCDAGFTGPHESVIGREIEPVVKRFLTNTPQRFGVARGRVVLQGTVIEVEEVTGKAVSIQRVSEPMPQ